MSTAISRLGQRLKKPKGRTGFHITLPAQSWSEDERKLAMKLGFAYSVLGFILSITCFITGAFLFKSGVVTGNGNVNAMGFQFEDLAPGTILFIIGWNSFKNSGFLVRTADNDPTEPVTDPTEPVTNPAEPVTDPAEPVTDPAKLVTDPTTP